MKSWDCFDTIIGRKHFHPKSIFHAVANKIQDASFVTQRVIAEQQSVSKTYTDIYQRLQQYDPEIEIQTEIEHTFPIKQNFDQIQDGDIIVSDMYLSADQIEKILRFHGLNKDITIYVSPSGKKNGSTWQKLKHKYAIESHIGDNIKSDIISARNHGIKAVYFPGRAFTKNENIAFKFCPQLAYLMRAVRLSCPYQSNNMFLFEGGSFQEIHSNEWIEEKFGKTYPWKFLKFLNNAIFLQKPNNDQNIISIDVNSIKKLDNTLHVGSWQSDDFMSGNPLKTIWNDQTQYNIPALISAAQLLPKDKKLIFTERDCWYLKLIYDSLYSTNSDMLDVSRKSYRRPYNKIYEKYIIDTTKNNIVVDIHGSGISPSIFFDSVKFDQNFIYICFHPMHSQIYSHINIDSLITCDAFRKCMGRAFEKFNIHNIGSLAGWGDNQPVRSPVVLDHAYDVGVSQELAINKCLEYLSLYSITTTADVLATFVQMMSNSYTNKKIKLS